MLEVTYKVATIIIFLSVNDKQIEKDSNYFFTKQV